MNTTVTKNSDSKVPAANANEGFQGWLTRMFGVAAAKPAETKPVNEINASVNGNVAKAPSIRTSENDSTSFSYTKGQRVTFNDDVLAMQKNLAALGYDLEAGNRFANNGVDGKFGSVTQKAVEKFQKEHGLEATGIANAETLASIQELAKSSGKKYVQGMGDHTSTMGHIKAEITETFQRASNFVKEVTGTDLTAHSTHPQHAKLLDFIAKPESRGNYNVVYGGKNYNLTDMSVNQVRDLQRQMVSSGSPSSATGRYQIIGKTMDSLVKEMNLKGDEKFTPELQDKMAVKLLERRGLDEYMRTGDIDKFAKNLSKEWASLPKDHSNLSFYHGDGLNKAHVTYASLKGAIVNNGPNPVTVAASPAAATAGVGAPTPV